MHQDPHHRLPPAAPGRTVRYCASSCHAVASNPAARDDAASVVRAHLSAPAERSAMSDGRPIVMRRPACQTVRRHNRQPLGMTPPGELPCRTESRTNGSLNAFVPNLYATVLSVIVRADESCCADASSGLAQSAPIRPDAKVSPVICSSARFRVSTPNTRIAAAASAIGTPPTRAVTASDGVVKLRT